MTRLLGPDGTLPEVSGFDLSRETLGEGYLIGTAVVLNVILFGYAFTAGVSSPLRIVVWSVPGLTLLGASLWLRRTELPEDHIWDVAEYTAFGIALGTGVTLGLAVFDGALSVSGSSTYQFGATVSVLAVSGVFAGTTRDVYHINRSLDLRNRVLRRVLRHDLRNDMTVVLCNLDEVESELEGEEREKVAKARRKIESVVDLTDKVRRVDVSAREDDGAVPVDLVTVLERRVALADSTHPEVDIELDLPKTAGAWAATDFGMVVDSVVESARSGPNVSPRLTFTVTPEDDAVCLTVTDENGTIPKADLEAVSSGSETALKHARGVELWMVRWLVEASDGDLTLDQTDRRIEIELDRVSNGHRRGARMRRWLTH